MPKFQFRPLSQLDKGYFEIFWPYVLTGEQDECWPWLGQESTNGYGQFFADHRLWTSHRIAYYLHYGVDPLQLEVCHKCDNPPCNNPFHLFLGTHKDNVQDCVKKGRTSHVPTALGEDCSWAKLTEANVRELREQRTQGISYAELGRRFGVCTMSAWHVVNKSWRHVT